MKPHHPGVKLWLFGLSALLIAATACGARSSLEEGRSGRSPVEADAGVGGGPVEADAGVGGGSIDAGPDVPPVNCEEAGVTYIYLFTQENDLFRFYPPDLSFEPIGPIQCPSAGSATPFSMAVDRKGTGYVLLTNGKIYRVSMSNASCKETSFVPLQDGFPTFGMGFSANKNDPGEQLFVAGRDAVRQLATIDTVSMDLNVIGAFDLQIGDFELTGTGDGRLFGLGRDSETSSFHFAEFDPSNAKVLSHITVPVGQPGSAFALAFWGGDFYFFTSINSGKSVVTRFRPDDGSLTAVTTVNRTIVGAGVSTCAPQ
jgi:hypothetical protein